MKSPDLSCNPLDRLSGPITSARILSNRICYGPRPDPQTEVEQHLLLSTDGRIQLTGFAFGDGVDLPQCRTISDQLDPARICALLDGIRDCFRQNSCEEMVTDCGVWSLTLTDTSKHSVTFTGCLAPVIPDLVRLSRQIRTALSMPDLFAFDGSAIEDSLQRLVLDFQDNDCARCEHLVLDRPGDSLEYTVSFGDGCRASRRYQLNGAVAGLLDRCEPDVLCDGFSLVPLFASTDRINHCALTLFFTEADPRMVSTGLNGHNLPEALIGLLKEIRALTELDGSGVLLGF